MATNSMSTSEENKSKSSDIKVTNETISNSTEDKKDTIKNSADKESVESPTNATEDNMIQGSEDKKPKSHFRKGNLFIDIAQANAFYKEKK